MTKIGRRGLLLGGSAAMLATTGALGKGTPARPPATPSLPPIQRAADAAAADYVALLSKVHDDYVNGRVVEHEGWVLSQHEFQTIDVRKAENAAAAAAG
ncbi:MAG TPA: hypothetical protein VHB74_12520 [Devosia sp.]|nr:hypothetical protein [Devosia sp.]